MPSPDIPLLNRRFGSAGRIMFRSDEAGLPIVSLVNTYAACEVSLYGGHVLDYRPAGLGPVLFVSKRAVFEPGKPIRGGIPICWPWFGKAEQTVLPAVPLPLHGFARIMQWNLSETEYTANTTELRLSLSDSELTRQIWDFAFALKLRIRLEQHLTLELVTENRDTRPFDLSQGFHPYFRVSDISAVSVHGLNGATFTNHPSPQREQQHGTLTLQGETNRIYTPEKNEIAIRDEKLKRATLITFSGTRNVVVWNPWAERIKTFDDLAPDDYTRMLCVEPANLGDTSITLDPNERHTLRMDIQARLT
ncbi:MAG: D-hexose-6-phosphate mutarotase [Kiritimatiellaeota bacterium]|nr:D-hexose-6-phosphate mutarotase [Kiritimatiellota bacterium]